MPATEETMGLMAAEVTTMHGAADGGAAALAESLLRTDLLSGLLGTFELVNMCISIPFIS